MSRCAHCSQKTRARRARCAAASRRLRAAAGPLAAGHRALLPLPLLRLATSCAGTAVALRLGYLFA